MKLARTMAALGCLLGSTPALHAQVPQLINYQGKVLVGTANFNGTGQFRFALVNANGSTTYWSNDGTSTAGSQPTAAVSLPVTSGLYAVALGDTTLANMTAVPASVFNNSDVRLRVWFNDGTNGAQLLTPDQRLTASGYAMIAGAVSDGAITSAKIASGAVGSAQLGGNLSLSGTTTGTFSGGLSGTFTGNTATFGALYLSQTTGASVGVIRQNGSSLLQTFGTNNTFVGLEAGNFTLTGTDNTALGNSALALNTTASNNTAIGSAALLHNTTASQNVAVGTGTLSTQSFDNGGAPWTGANVAVGFQALFANQPTAANNGFFNTAVGNQALTSNTTGSSNTASGGNALYANTTGTGNTAVGQGALLQSNGAVNTAFGYQSLNNLVVGGSNVAIGPQAGYYLTAGNNNVYLANTGLSSESNTIRIGIGGGHLALYLAAVRGVTTGVNNGLSVMIDGNGQLGTISSSRRYKEEIADMGDASARLLSLRPVTFRYKKPFKDGGKPVQFGLIAEEVAETFPELAVFNEEGQPESVKYQDLAPLLLNEFLKEHKRVDEKDAEIRKLTQRLSDLETRLGKLERPIPSAAK